MADVFRIEMLPALDGDCLLVEWGTPAEVHRMLIDGGRSGDKRALPALLARVDRMPERDRRIDLLVATHIDADHINGLVPLLRTRPAGLTVKEVWFNALRHLPRPASGDTLGTDKADELSHVLRGRYEWNTRWEESPLGAVVVPDEGQLPSREVAGLKLTLLSPTEDKLRELRKEWPAAVREAGLDPEEPVVPPEPATGDTLGKRDEDADVEPSDLAGRPYTPDPSRPNGSSIALLAQYDRWRVLLAADAHAEVLVRSLRRLKTAGRYHVDACKLSHHGSAGNLSPELRALLDCPAWLVSTNGRKPTCHPDRRAMAWLITRPDERRLYFNYRSITTEEWGKAGRQREYGYTATHPPADAPGLVYDVISGTALVGEQASKT